MSNLTDTVTLKVDSVLDTYSLQDRERVEGLLNGTINSLVDLVCAHWKNLDQLLLESEKPETKFSLSVKVDMAEKQSKVVSKISYSKRTSDSVEIPVDKPIEVSDV